MTPAFVRRAFAAVAAGQYAAVALVRGTLWPVGLAAWLSLAVPANYFWGLPGVDCGR